MKQLQNNFTTPEQSKRLLELGLPQDSADCRMYIYHGVPQISVHRGGKNNQAMRFSKSLPCWSVGRLIEIIKIISTDDDAITEILVEMQYSIDIVQDLVQAFSEYADLLDFSKLED